MTFHVGQKVVCVDAAFTVEPGRPNKLREGEVYTIASIQWEEAVVPNQYGYEGETLALKELPRGFLKGFASGRFRSLRTTDISIFKAMLAPTPKKEALGHDA